MSSRFIDYYILMALGEHKLLNTQNLVDLIPCSHNTLRVHLNYLKKIKVIKATRVKKYMLYEINYSHLIKLKKELEKHEL